MSETGGILPGAVPPAKTSLAQKFVVGAALLLLAVCLGGGVYYVRKSDPQHAKVGDCVSQDGEDAVSIVGCGDSDADFTVVGRLENRTQTDAGLFACDDVEGATSSYWEGEQAEKGTVLCLAKR
jgi:hypothetical protein